jgi:CheY-like chemotaxis protein
VALVAQPPTPDRRHLVLVVEDEPAIADLVVLHLQHAGFATHVERDGAAAVEAVARHTPAVVILDIGLPGQDGIEVCRALRSAGDWTPVLFLTARDDHVDRVVGLELGADDYITKPFSPHGCRRCCAAADLCTPMLTSCALAPSSAIWPGGGSSSTELRFLSQQQNSTCSPI